MEKEKLFEQLPENIATSTEMSDDAKRVLGALLYWLFNTKAYDTGIIAINNIKLRAISGIKQNYMFDAIAELKDFNLVERKVGTERGCASEYTINWDNIRKPLKKKSFEDRFSKFFEGDKSLETPLGTTIHYNTIHNNTIHNNTYQDNTLQYNSNHNISFEEKDIKKEEVETEKEYNSVKEIKERLEELKKLYIPTPEGIEPLAKLQERQKNNRPIAREYEKLKERLNTMALEPEYNEIF